MKKCVAFCMLWALGGVATADVHYGNGVPNFTYNRSTGLLTVAMDGDEDLISWVIPYAGEEKDVDISVSDFPPGPDNANLNGSWAVGPLHRGLLQWANTTQDVRIGRLVSGIRPLPEPPWFEYAFDFDNHQVFTIARLPTIGIRECISRSSKSSIGATTTMDRWKSFRTSRKTGTTSSYSRRLTGFINFWLGIDVAP